MSNDREQWVDYLHLDGRTYTQINLATYTDRVILFDHPGLGDPLEEPGLSGLVQHWLYRMPGDLWIEFRNVWASDEDVWASGGQIPSHQMIYQEATAETAKGLRASVGADPSIGSSSPRPPLDDPPADLPSEEGRTVPDPLPSANGPPRQGAGGSGPAEEEEFALELRQEGKATRAQLVEYMIGKQAAKGADVARDVHSDQNTSDEGIRINCGRVNADAERLGRPFRYYFKTGKVLKRLDFRP
jgi:hypothetical protein